MSHQPLADHPLIACVGVIEAALKDVAGVDPGFMRPEDKAEALWRLSRIEDQVTALRLRVMANAGEVAEATADRSVATWLAVETRSEVGRQSADLSLARGLEHRWVRLREAVADGSVNLAQARVIARALEDLPEREVGAALLTRAEEALIGYAAEYGPRELRRLGRRILEVAAPDECDQQEALALEREERRAAAATTLSLRRVGDGTTRLSGRLPDAVADRLRTYLDAYTSPRHGATGEGDRVPPRRRLAEAFAAFLEAADPRGCPCTAATQRPSS